MQLQHFKAPKWRPSSLLAEDAENCSNSAMGGTWVKGGGGRGNRRSWPPLSHLLEAGVRGGGGGQGEERTN
jgi:hypothetical protein